MGDRGTGTLPCCAKAPMARGPWCSISSPWALCEESSGRNLPVLSLGAARPTGAKVVTGVAWLRPGALPEGPWPQRASLVIPPCSSPSQGDAAQLSLALGHSKHLLPKLESARAESGLKITLHPWGWGWKLLPRGGKGRGRARARASLCKGYWKKVSGLRFRPKAGRLCPAEGCGHLSNTRGGQCWPSSLVPLANRPSIKGRALLLLPACLGFRWCLFAF